MIGSNSNEKVHIHTGKCIRRFAGIRVLLVLHRPEVVDIGVKSYIYIKHAIRLKGL